MLGGVLSATVMCWLSCGVCFPLQSVASQVLVSLKVPGHVPGVVTSLTRFTVAPPQVSEAVGGVNDGVAGHSRVALCPAVPIVGGVVSATVIVWLPVAVSLPLSDA